MAGVSYINPEVNPDTIHRYVVFGIRANPNRRGVDEAQDQEGAGEGQLQVMVHVPIQKASYAKNITLGIMMGAGVGAVAGVIVAIPFILAKRGNPASKLVTKVSILGERAALKIMSQSALIGAGCGGVIGGGTAAIQTFRYNRALVNLQRENGGDLPPDPVDLAIQNRREEVVEMCRALFDAMFEDVDVLCAISHDVMIMPTNMPQVRGHSRCTGVFEFENIHRWVRDQGTCPLCRCRVSVEDLRFCDRIFIRINRAVRSVLTQLKQVIDQANPALLEQALNNPEVQIDENTAGRIRAGAASPIECAIIARYLGPGIANYNAAIMNIYLQQVQYLEVLRNNGTLTPAGFFAESRRIADWCETYQFSAE